LLLVSGVPDLVFLVHVKQLVCSLSGLMALVVDSLLIKLVMTGRRREPSDQHKAFFDAGII
jgi:hypothetical protein